MITKIIGGIAILIAISSITDAYTQKSVVTLREEKYATFSPQETTPTVRTRGSTNRRNTTTTIVVPSGGDRSSYTNFRGGGPGSGK